ncbi:hypothetical protein [Desulfatibacillum aliphaticivorans]|uniref:hypothetical protein n=1 Tax=Desulfatibacillum aliphaticivorans TaxID=218208 RepID=UPI00048917FF|nr:hypothetical protein [Desulfatibacillum aliphaticivorans]
MNGIKYVKERGIYLWENKDPYLKTGFLTLTIVAENKSLLTEFLAVFLENIAYLYKSILRWKTWGGEFKGNRMQKKKLLDSQHTPPPGCKSVYAPNELVKNVPCTVCELSLPFNSYHYDCMRRGRKVMLVLPTDDFFTPKRLFEDAVDYLLGLTEKELFDFLDRRRNAMVARAWEDEDIHAVFQFIGGEELIEQISYEIEKEGIPTGIFRGRESLGDVPY